MLQPLLHSCWYGYAHSFASIPDNGVRYATLATSKEKEIKMSTWRQKAIDIAPELKRDFQAPDLSPYTVFSELLPLLKEAHINNDTKRLSKIYEYAEWFSRQKEQQLWNAAGVSFYEHLADSDIVFAQFTTWVKKGIYFEIRELLNERFEKEKMEMLDKYYGWAKNKTK